jgi:hypothetical protein
MCSSLASNKWCNSGYYYCCLLIHTTVRVDVFVWSDSQVVVSECVRVFTTHQIYLIALCDLILAPNISKLFIYINRYECLENLQYFPLLSFQKCRSNIFCFKFWDINNTLSTPVLCDVDNRYEYFKFIENCCYKRVMWESNVKSIFSIFLFFVVRLNNKNLIQ